MKRAASPSKKKDEQKKKKRKIIKRRNANVVNTLKKGLVGQIEQKEKESEDDLIIKDFNTFINHLSGQCSTKCDQLAVGMQIK